MKNTVHIQNILNILKILKKEYPQVRVALNFGNVFQLLVAVILSAQCTDERVNKVTPALFKKYPRVEDFARARLPELEKMIFSTGFYKNKSKNIKGAAMKIVSDFEGRIPSQMEDLLTLPGVARKTANVILHSAFGKNEGIVVDTHVCRVSGRLGLVPMKMSRVKNAVGIERILMEIVPRNEWGNFALRMVFHGRRVCVARGPRCGICALKGVCPSAKL